jgi:hypothetical protein
MSAADDRAAAFAPKQYRCLESRLKRRGRAMRFRQKPRLPDCLNERWWCFLDRRPLKTGRFTMQSDATCELVRIS